MKKILVGAFIIAASFSGGAHAQTAFDAEVDAVASGCAADPAECQALVDALLARARLAGALTPDLITRMTVAISTVAGPTAPPAVRAQIAAAIQALAAASPDPAQAVQVAQIAQTVAAGGGVDTAAIGGVAASGI